MKESVKIAADTMIGLNDITLKGEIVVFGSTYMSKFPLYELINKSRLEYAVYNRSIAGLTVKEALEIVRDCIIAIRPSKVFVALGEEDEKNKDAIKQYNEIVQKMRAEMPKCQIFLIELLGDGAYEKEFNENFLSKHTDKLAEFIKLGLLIIDRTGNIKSTPTGFLVLNKIILELCS